jgi:hypothetical protein
MEMEGLCLGRKWTRSAALPVPAVARGSTVEGSLRDLVLAEFRKLPAY